MMISLAFIDVKGIILEALAHLINAIFDGIVNVFSALISDVMKLSLSVLDFPIVVDGIKYAQALALALLVLKTMNEGFQTYILYQNGDSSADPTGLLVRTAQSVAVIACLPWIVGQLFAFSTKMVSDVSNIGTNSITAETLKSAATLQGAANTVNNSLAMSILLLIMVIALIIVAVQASIRGAELALMSVIGPILALNITSTNRELWGSWFKQVTVICVTQAIQLFMLRGVSFLFMNQNPISSHGGTLNQILTSQPATRFLLAFGWLWITIKSPKFMQQFTHSTGFSGSAGRTAASGGRQLVSLLRGK